jgi:hypothetical protein
MCPNCLSTIAMAPWLLTGLALGGSGSAVLFAAGLRFQTVRSPKFTQSSTEETGS